MGLFPSLSLSVALSLNKNQKSGDLCPLVRPPTSAFLLSDGVGKEVMMILAARLHKCKQTAAAAAMVGVARHAYEQSE